MKLGNVTKSSVALVLVPLATSILLAGCGGDTKPDASRSSTASPPATATIAAPTTAASPTSTPSPTTNPNVPVAARAHTPAGAEAFVRYFYSQLNVAWSEPKAGLLSGLSESTCKTCANFEREAAKSVLKSERVIGQSIVLTTVETSDASNSAKLTVLAIGYQPKSLVVNSAGKTVQSLERERVRNQVTVLWGAAGWRLREIQSLA